MSAMATTFRVPTIALPSLPEQEPLTAEQWSILTAIADAVVPSLTRTNDQQHSSPSPSASASNDQHSPCRQHSSNHQHSALKANSLLQHPLRIEVYDAAARRIEKLSKSTHETTTAYLGESAAEQPEFKELVSRLLTFHMSDKAKNGLLFILSALK